jgi:hypothetical protein
MNHGPLNHLEMEFLARISVLEYLVAQLFSKQYQAKRLTVDEVKAEHEKAKKLLARQANPEFYSFQSDLITGEMETALDSVLKMIEEMFEREFKEDGASLRT